MAKVKLSDWINENVPDERYYFFCWCNDKDRAGACTDIKGHYREISRI